MRKCGSFQFPVSFFAFPFSNSMAEPPNSPDVIQLERRLLRLLCQEPAVREFGRTNLQRYRWCDLVHGVIFEIVTSTPQVSVEQLRQQLPARLTKAGFPDFPWEEFFPPLVSSPGEAERLILHLHEAGGVRRASLWLTTLTT